MAFRQTPSQTVGPFFSFGLAPEQYGYAFRSIAGSVLIDDSTPGARIRIVGRVYDGEGQPLSDALIEIWQADAEGRYAHPADPRSSNAAFKGFGRTGTGTDPESRFIFDTVMPGAVAGQAPHINVIVLARGMLNHLYTRLYFEDHAEAKCPRSGAAFRAARAPRHAPGAPRRHIGACHLSLRHPPPGRRETVFFDV